MDDEDIDLLTKRLDVLQDRLTRLEAERRITHVMYRYIRACDKLKDAETIASFFAEDAVWEGRGGFAEFGSTVGREAIQAMFVENPTVLPFTAHFLANPVIVLSQDGREGWGQWHTLEAATLRDGVAQVWILAEYDNDFVFVDNDWKIKHIRYTDTCVVPYEEGWLKARYVSPLTLKKETSL